MVFRLISRRFTAFYEKFGLCHGACAVYGAVNSRRDTAFWDFWRFFHGAAYGAVYGAAPCTTLVDRWIREVKEHTDENIQIMLVGNKLDLMLNRKVPTDEARQYAQQHGYSFIETSAYTCKNVDEAFTQTITGIYDKLPKNAAGAAKKKPVKDNNTVEIDAPAKEASWQDQMQSTCCQTTWVQFYFANRNSYVRLFFVPFYYISVYRDLD